MQSWLAYASQKNNEYVNAHNDRIPDDVLIADWNADHPPVVVRETPFGPVPDAQASLLAAIDALLAKHFADFQKR